MSAKQNGRMPIHPLTPEQERACLPDDRGYGSIGLTKREAVAIAVMQGFAADPGTTETRPEALATCAARWADALLTELAKPAPQAGPHPSLTYDKARETIIKAGAPYCGYTDRAVTAIDAMQFLGTPAGTALVTAAKAVLPPMEDGLRVMRSSGTLPAYRLSQLAELERAVENVRRIAAGEALPK